jgi:hypothetical protein
LQAQTLLISPGCSCEIGAIDYLTKPAAPERNPISSAYTAALAETPAAREQTRFNEFPTSSAENVSPDGFLIGCFFLTHLWTLAPQSRHPTLKLIHAELH